MLSKLHVITHYNLQNIKFLRKQNKNRMSNKTKIKFSKQKLCVLCLNIMTPFLKKAQT